MMMVGGHCVPVCVRGDGGDNTVLQRTGQEAGEVVPGGPRLPGLMCSQLWSHVAVPRDPMSPTPHPTSLFPVSDSSRSMNLGLSRFSS